MSDGLSDILDAPLPPLASFIGRPTTQANPPVTSPNRPPVTPPYRPPPVTPPNRPPPVTPPNRPLPVTPPNRPPPVTPPNRPAGTPVNRAPLVPRIPADQVPLPDPPFEALRAIRNYFVKGGQCACEGPVGAGAFGSVYRLRQVGGGGGEGTPGAGRRVVAKLVRRFPDPRYASGTLLDEVEALQVSFHHLLLRWDWTGATDGCYDAICVELCCGCACCADDRFPDVRGCRPVRGAAMDLAGIPGGRHVSRVHGAR